MSHLRPEGGRLLGGDVDVVGGVVLGDPPPGVGDHVELGRAERAGVPIRVERRHVQRVGAAGVPRRAADHVAIHVEVDHAGRAGPAVQREDLALGERLTERGISAVVGGRLGDGLLVEHATLAIDTQRGGVGGGKVEVLEPVQRPGPARGRQVLEAGPKEARREVPGRCRQAEAVGRRAVLGERSARDRQEEKAGHQGHEEGRSRLGHGGLAAAGGISQVGRVGLGPTRGP